MYIVASHTISNPEKFWGLAKSTPVPAALKLHSALPSTDGARGSCLWEAASLEAVKQFVEPLTQGVSKNDYMVVEATQAMGLPK